MKSKSEMRRTAFGSPETMASKYYLLMKKLEKKQKQLLLAVKRLEHIEECKTHDNCICHKLASRTLTNIIVEEKK